MIKFSFLKKRNWAKCMRNLEHFVSSSVFQRALIYELSNMKVNDFQRFCEAQNDSNMVI